MDDATPIYSQPALGYRIWVFSRGYLYSLSQHGVIWRPGENTAYCSVCAGLTRVSRDPHDAPAAGCHCGWNAWNDLEDALYSALANTSPVSLSQRQISSDRPFDGCYIAGAILGAGNIQVHNKGWRSERAQVLALYEYDELSDLERELVERRYQAPVIRDRDELSRFTIEYDPPPEAARPEEVEKKEPAWAGPAVNMTMTVTPSPGGPSLEESLGESFWYKLAMRSPLSISSDGSIFTWLIQASLLAIILAALAIAGSLIVPADVVLLYWGVIASISPALYLYTLRARQLTARLGLDCSVVIKPKERGAGLARQADSNWRKKSWRDLRAEASLSYLLLISIYRSITAGRLILIAASVLIVPMALLSVQPPTIAIGFTIITLALLISMRMLSDMGMSWMTRTGRESHRRGRRLTVKQYEVQEQIPWDPAYQKFSDLNQGRSLTILAYIWDHALIFSAGGYMGVMISQSIPLTLLGVPVFFTGVWWLARWQLMTRLMVILRLKP